MRSTALRAVGVLAVLVGLAGGTGVGPARADASAVPVRILIVGDSVTQGSAGDWTWRYRLWQHFQDAGLPVDFVGPRDDLYDNVSQTQGSTAYADPVFDTDHAARWGMQLGAMDEPIDQLVVAYQPDVVVEMLGVNNLIFGSQSPEAVAAATEQFVADVRSADPSVKVVLAEGTQTWLSGVPDFDALLPGVAADTTSADSPVVVASTASGYDDLADTWDDSHPNARGEVKIAAAMADALNELGVGPAAARPLVMPPVGPRTGATLTAQAGDGQAALQWTGPPGATGEYVWVRDTSVSQPWTRLPYELTGVSSWTAGLMVDDDHYQFRLQPVKGDDDPEGSVYSNVVDVLPHPPPPTAPVHLRGRAGASCVALSWQAPLHADHYQVQLRRSGSWRNLAWTRRTSFVARRLPPLSQWTLRVRSWHTTFAGGQASVTVRRLSGSC